MSATEVFAVALLTDVATGLGVVPVAIVPRHSTRWPGLITALAGGMMLSALKREASIRRRRSSRSSSREPTPTSDGPMSPAGRSAPGMAWQSRQAPSTRAPVRPGEHTAEVLKEKLGTDDDEVHALRERGVIL